MSVDVVLYAIVNSLFFSHSLLNLMCINFGEEKKSVIVTVLIFPIQNSVNTGSDQTLQLLYLDQSYNVTY